MWTMRGGAAAGVGITTQLRLRLIDELDKVAWCRTKLSKKQLADCVKDGVFASSCKLVKEISIAFQLYFDDDQVQPVCSMNISSLLPINETILHLRRSLEGAIVTSISNPLLWHEGSLMDIRMLPASEFLKDNPQMLSEVTEPRLHDEPLRYWSKGATAREMMDSYMSTSGAWVVPECDTLILDMYEAFETAVNHHLRSRMYALVVAGGGKITENQSICSMPLGEAVARFEIHWDEPDFEDDIWISSFSDRMYALLRTKENQKARRPPRGDIWLAE